MSHSHQAGFSAAELLISLFIGAAFIGAAYQLYGIAIGDSGNNRMHALASNTAYAAMRSQASQITSNSNASICVPVSTTPLAVPNGISLPSPVSMTLTNSCPYAAIDGSSLTSGLTQVTVAITYGPSAQKITHSVYVSK